MNRLIRTQLVFALSIAFCPVASAQLEPPLIPGQATESNDFIVSSFLPADTQTRTVSHSSDEGEMLDERVRRLEEELYQLRNQPRMNSYPVQARPQDQQDVGTGRLFGAIEVTFLKPHLSGAQSAFGLGPGQYIDTNYSTSVRYILGYQNDSGLGVRARYWSFDDSFGFAPPFVPSRLGIRLDVVDTEITFAQGLRNWDLEVSGGLRYGKLEYSNNTASLFGVGLLTFEGVGPTFSLAGRRNLGDSGLSLLGNVRGSALMGSVRNGSLLTFMPRGKIEGEIMTVAESQLGVAWTRNLSSTWQLEVRTAWETQYWMSSTISDDVYGIGSNLALAGPTLALELRY